MSKEYVIYAIEVILVLFLLFRFIPKDKLLEAQLAYLFKLVITWSIGLLVAEYQLVEYPVRIFPYATKANFLFEFFYYPAICAIFIVNFPVKKNSFTKFMYYFYYCTALTIVEVIEERYTDILTYKHWTWYVTWITFFMTFYVANKYNQWFFSRVKAKS